MMKNVSIVLMIALGFFSSKGFAQELAMAETPNAPAASNERIITFKNSAEKSIAVFAGAREGIKDPKVKTFGGLSKNTLYLNLNDVVCLMTNDKQPVACTIIKDGVTSVEVNTSATTISSK